MTSGGTVATVLNILLGTKLAKLYVTAYKTRMWQNSTRKLCYCRENCAMPL